jgi:AcrR family transcriptional regulator
MVSVTIETTTVEQEIRRRTGGRSARVTQQVHNATRQLLFEGDPITMAAIAERSGVHLSTIYRRWGDLASLQLEVALDIAGTLIPMVDTGSLAADLLVFARGSVGFVMSTAGRRLVTSLLDLEPSQRQWYWTQRFNAIRVPFDRAIDRGEITDDSHVDEALINLTGALYFRVLFAGDEAAVEPTARAIVNVALATVGAPLPDAARSTTGGRAANAAQARGPV